MAINLPAPRSGGIMANYACTSRCAHCAYFCGPEWSNDYIQEQTARTILRKLSESGCGSVHIGGGEPFLGRSKLVDLICWCHDEGVGVEYVETNASWYNGSPAADGLLRELKEAGLSTLLISISPFHNEYIPWKKTRALIEGCNRIGMSVFPWVESFISDLSGLDPDTTHTLPEFEESYGEGYIEDLPNRYWISTRGRAVETFAPLAGRKSVEAVVAESHGPCRELFDSSHFHIDLYENYIPGVCTGLAVSIDAIGQPLDPEIYPFLQSLMSVGIGGLLELARDEFGFVPLSEYAGKCELCYDIRRFLVTEVHANSRDLRPVALYGQMQKRRSF